MLELTLKCRDAWFPPDASVGWLHEHKLTAKQAVAVAIAHAMPDIVIKNFKQIFGEELKTEEVFFDIEKRHVHCSSNQPDMTVAVKIRFTKDRHGNKGLFRPHICGDLQDFLLTDMMLQPGSAKFPSVLVTVEFSHETGASMNRMSQSIDNW